MKIALLLTAMAATAGCATVIRGTKETSRFESTPSGALVMVESISTDKLGPFTCVTPCELELKRKREWNVVFTLDGYKPVTGQLVPKLTGGGVASGAGNVIAGGIIGIGVDAGTGANLDLRPNPMIAKLAPVDSAEESTILADIEVKAKKSEKLNKGSDKDDAAVPEADPVPAVEAAPTVDPVQAEPAAPASAPEPLVMEPIDSAGGDNE
ncbi:MAG: hypothetical protein U5J99_08775 [Parvularculaceae bacterium]|nr:hypothetical protein [Parvularculaceae bacterium]